MVTANFLTEDTYLGSINEPLTLNRYNYCISSYPNYEDPSGNSHNEYHPQAEMMEYMYWLTGDEKYSELAEELYGQQIEMEYYEASTSAGVVDSVLAAAANTVIFTYNVVAMGTNLTQSLFAREHFTGQWAPSDLDYATEMANTLKPGESGYFDLPEGAQSVVHMPDGTTQPATRMWIRNNGTGTWHGYPMQ